MSIRQPLRRPPLAKQVQNVTISTLNVDTGNNRQCSASTEQREIVSHYLA